MGVLFFLGQFAPVSKTGKRISQPIIKTMGKQTTRDKEDLLILGGSIYGDAFRHFSAISLKLGSGANFLSGDAEVTFEPRL